MARILAKDKTYSGVRAGVRFVNGKAETENASLIGWFKSKGYGVEETAKEQMKEPKHDKK